MPSHSSRYSTDFGASNSPARSARPAIPVLAVPHSSASLLRRTPIILATIILEVRSLPFGHPTGSVFAILHPAMLGAPAANGKLCRDMRRLLQSTADADPDVGRQIVTGGRRTRLSGRGRRGDRRWWC